MYFHFSLYGLLLLKRMATTKVAVKRENIVCKKYSFRICQILVNYTVKCRNWGISTFTIRQVICGNPNLLGQINVFNSGQKVWYPESLMKYKYLRKGNTLCSINKLLGTFKLIKYIC